LAQRRSPGDDSRVLRKYLEEIARTPTLTPEREKELGRVIQDPASDEASRTEAVEDLVRGNLRFVVSYAKKFHSPDVPFVDLISEGNVGLMQAARKFDPNRNVKFITYAVWWVRQAISHALMEQSGAVRLPHRQAALQGKIVRARDALRRSHLREPSVEEIAAEVGDRVTADDVEILLAVASRGSDSISQGVGEEQERSLADTLEQTQFPAPDAELLRRSAIEGIRGLLDELPPKERAVLCRRFGIRDDGEGAEREPMTLQEVGEELHLSRERVRQIEAQAMARLKKLTRTHQIDAHLN